MIVTVMIRLAQRVLAVTHSTYRSGKSLAIFFIDRNCGSHLQRILHWGAIHLAGISNRKVFTNGNIFIHIIRRIHTS